MDTPYHQHDIEHELAECCLDCATGLTSIKRHILAFHDRMVGYSSDADKLLGFDDVRVLYAELDDVVRLHDPSDNLVATLLADAEVHAILPDLCAAYSTFFQLHEREFAEGLLVSDDPWATLERFVFYPNYVSLIDAEVRLAGLKRGDRVAFVGCGPLPLTNILLAARHDLRTVAIEEDPELVALANRVVDRLELEHGVQIIRGDHLWLSSEQTFDLVMVAAQANPRQQVLEHLLRILPVGAHILLRTYQKGLRRILAGDDGLQLPKGLTLLDTVDPGPPVNNTIVLVEVAS